MKKNWWKLLVVAALVVAVALVVASKSKSPEISTSAIPPIDNKITEKTPAVPEPAVKPAKKPEEPKPIVAQESSTDKAPAEVEAPKPKPKPPVKAAPKQLPKMLELGADKCIPCKMMKPVMAELEKEYKGKLAIEFIDVWENKGAGEKYGIRFIPTQIFFDANGKEFFRHQGFFPKEEILKTFKDHDINLDTGSN